MEYFFNCPYCREEISVLIDLSENEQSYIEDCEVCCKPIQLNFSIEMNNKITNFSAEMSD